KEKPNARLVGSLLMVDDRPLFPRIIQHRGEPLAFLRNLGFNAVWFNRLPNRRMLSEADRLGLWIVCPPPQADTSIPGTAFLPPIGPQYENVLAWDLGRGLSQEHLDRLRDWAEQVRAADRHKGRPLVCNAESKLRSYSRIV
ncbi:unnamed protein product, partial [marine sediment metagenome]